MRPGSERNGQGAPTEARNFLEGVVLVGRDGGDLGVGHRDPRVERGQLEMLLVLLGAVVAAGEGQDQGVAALALHLMTITALTGATYDIDGGQQLVPG